MRSFLMLLVLPLIASNKKTEPMAIPQKQVYKEAKEKVRQQRLAEMHQANKKAVSVDELKKTNQIIAETNDKFIYSIYNPKNEEKDK